MIDYNNLPDGEYKTFIYDSAGRYLWSKPRGITMVYILCMGSGGGGGSGQTGASGTTRSGGGGGACGGITKLIIPAFLIPNTLYCVVGQGGNGGSSGNGGSGNLSYIEFEYSSARVSTNTLVISDLVAAGGGQSSGTGGAVPQVATLTTAIYHNLGCFTTLIGIVGAAGGNGGSGTAVSFGNVGNLNCPGSGGGGVTSTDISQQGGAITSIAPLPNISASLSSGTNGTSGISSYKPLYFYGGTGGAGNSAGTGGTGGDGANGCGGGGGGAGITGGDGGRGGDGLIYIICW